MDKSDGKKPTATALVMGEAILGSPVLLTTESDKQYNEMLDHLIEALQPDDGLEFLLVRQVLHETWKILRYERHQTLGIDRRFRQSVEFQTTLKAERLKKRDALATKLAEKTGRPATELSQMKELYDLLSVGERSSIIKLLRRVWSFSSSSTTLSARRQGVGTMRCNSWSSTERDRAGSCVNSRTTLSMERPSN